MVSAKLIRMWLMTDVLTSNTAHTWSPNPDWRVQQPDYSVDTQLGGSKFNWTKMFNGSSTRDYLSFWGSETGQNGGCCDDGSTQAWGRAFTVSIARKRKCSQ